LPKGFDKIWKIPELMHRLAVRSLPPGDSLEVVFLDWEWVESLRKFGAVGIH